MIDISLLIAAAASVLSLLVLAALLLRKVFLAQVDRQTLRYQSDLLTKHCQEVENMYSQVRGWRHDYHNHIQTMKAHLAMGRLAELDAYLNELDADLAAVDMVVKTGNVMIDAVLNSKLSLAKARDITVDAKALVPKDLKSSVTEVDICLILGNLMDNAMEACMKIEDSGKRFIRVYIDILKGQLYLYVMNATKDAPRKNGSGYLSTKTGEGHGFGLMRIDKVVNRYQGYLDRQFEEGVFATEVMLPLSGFTAR